MLSMCKILRNHPKWAEVIEKLVYRLKIVAVPEDPGLYQIREFYKKKTEQASFSCEIPTSHAHSGIKLSKMPIFKLHLPMTHSKKQIQAENEVYA